MPPIIYLAETTSTNSYLKELALQQVVEEGTVVYTDFQTSGKGQRGNGWESGRGENLLLSILFNPTTIPANQQFIISQFVSLAIKEALSQYTEGITIKWPNDIYWNEKKICGILVENNLTGDHIDQSIIGIGININQGKFEGIAPNPVSLKQITNRSCDTKQLLKEVTGCIISYYNKTRKGETRDIITDYKLSLFRKDGFHLYSDGTNSFEARLIDVEEDGMLVLETTDQKIRRFAFKEVRYIL